MGKFDKKRRFSEYNKNKELSVSYDKLVFVSYYYEHIVQKTKQNVQKRKSRKFSFLETLIPHFMEVYTGLTSMCLLYIS